jgi:hypothetical protein
MKKEPFRVTTEWLFFLGDAYDATPGYDLGRSRT